MKRKAKRRSPEGARAMKHFMERTAGCPCMMCDNQKPKNPAPHHIVHRRGKVYDVEYNLLRVCMDCHPRCHGETVVLHGVRLLPYTREEELAAKRLWDPGYWDLESLEKLNGLPGPPRPLF